MLALLVCTAVATAQNFTPSVFQVYKVHVYSPISKTTEVLNVDYPIVIVDGVVRFDNRGNESYRVTQSTVQTQEVGDATIITSRGVDYLGKFVSLILYMSPKKAYFQVKTELGYISTYYFTTY